MTNSSHSNLPTPSDDAIAHSKELIKNICRAIKASANQTLPFDEYMRMCLYEPGLGYYQSGTSKFGESGDFITAPEVSPLFGQCIAKQIAPTLKQLQYPIIFELGAGTGKLALDVLTQLKADNALPNQYQILEPSPDLQARQKALLQEYLPDYIDRIQWRTRLPLLPFNGVILGNEVIDAMPVKRFQIKADQMDELGVIFDGQRFQYQTFEPEQETLELLKTRLPRFARNDGDRKRSHIANDHALEHPSLARHDADVYTTEANMQLSAWIKSLTEKLQHGMALFFDYGYAQREYYHPDRHMGTLMCYYRHHKYDDPFVYPGLQDITASVDFTAVAEAGIEAGLTLEGYTTQALFLAANQIEHLLQEQISTATTDVLKLQAQCRTLIHPSQMGETIKAIALTKGLADNPCEHWANLKHTL